jgi:hypothetical protein
MEQYDHSDLEIKQTLYKNTFNIQTITF